MNSELRKYRRLETRILIDLGEGGKPSKDDVEAVCVDLSLSGMKILLPVFLETGKHVLVTCVMNRRGLEHYYLETQAVVRWCNSENENDTFAAGIEFEYLPDRDREAIEEFSNA